MRPSSMLARPAFLSAMLAAIAALTPSSAQQTTPHSPDRPQAARTAARAGR